MITLIEKRAPIYCDCCSTEVMGYLTGDKLTWYDQRRGTRHVVTIYLDKVLENCNPKDSLTK